MRPPGRQWKDRLPALDEGDATKPVIGAEMVELLGAMPPGESVIVDGSQEWCSLDDWQFEVTENGRPRVVGREEAEDMFDPRTMYEVTR